MSLAGTDLALALESAVSPQPDVCQLVDQCKYLRGFGIGSINEDEGSEVIY